jgi:3-carboxy-cis,cis-muconate cycloisomerase
MLSNNNSYLYIKLYSEKNIDKILSDSSLIKKILLFELMLAKVNYELNFISFKAYKKLIKILKSSNFNISELQNNLEYSGVVTLNLLNIIKKKIDNNYISYLHYGATSQDAIDTATILQIKEARILFIKNLKKISHKLYNIALDNKQTFTIGRTRNKHASLTTFGLKVVNWLLPLLRHVDRLNTVCDRGLLSLQLGGAVGNLAAFNNKGNLVKRKLAAYLGLDFDYSSWHNQRDNLVEFCNILAMITGAIGKIAKDLLILSQDEILEINFKKSGKSSSMPHKNNPIIAELLITLAKLNSNNLVSLHDSLMHKNERDGISWAIEWHALDNMLRLTSASLNHFNKCITTIKINRKRMKDNIENTYGVIISDYIYKKLVKEYPDKKIEKIFPDLIKKALKQKIHLLDIINYQLGINLNINKKNVFSKAIGVNDSIITNTHKKLKTTF